MRTLVISAGTAEKRDQVPDPALAAELADPARRRAAEQRLEAFACPASALYTGAHHRLVMEALWSVWERWGRGLMDLAILSAGYGLIPADEMIVPYEAAFAEDPLALEEWSSRHQVRSSASALLCDADLAFLLLSGPALASLHLPLEVPATVQLLVLTDAASLETVPWAPNLHGLVAARARAAQRWHVKSPQVCGFLFGRVCEQIVRHGPSVLEWLRDHPLDLDRLFYKRSRWKPQMRFWERGQGERQTSVRLG